MQPRPCTAPVHPRPQTKDATEASAQSSTLSQSATIDRLTPHWNVGCLFRACRLGDDPHARTSYTQISPDMIPPELFFNDSTYHNECSDVWVSQVDRVRCLYAARIDGPSFQVLPQLARPAPQVILGKRPAPCSELRASLPPIKKTRSDIKNAGPTRIRKDRRVRTPVYDDIWKRIFELSDPAMLFTYERVSKDFHGALSTYSHIWKNSMFDHFGEDLPNTPNNLQDRQYADLLSGQGCMSCKEPKARKTYWAFLRRWCTKCFSHKVIKQEDCFAITRKFPGILECIPCATVDSWNHYSYAGWGDENGRSTASGNQPVFLKHDVSTIAAAYEGFQASLEIEESTEEEKGRKRSEWIKERRESAKDIMDQRLEVDKFEKKWIAARAAKSTDLKNMRKEFIVRKARELTPPICEGVLRLIPAFQENIKINKEFKTEKFWKVLLPKLEEARPMAERLFAMETKADAVGYWDRLPDLRSRTLQMATLASNDHANLIHAVDRALTEVSRMITHNQARMPMPHQEFTLRVLNTTRSIWTQSCPIAHLQIPDDSPFITCYHPSNRYVLTLEHARQIYEDKIIHQLPKLYPELRPPTRNVQKFKCPGCKRNDVCKQRTFQQLMIHIRDEHATTIGDFEIFRLAGFGADAYLCAVPWPINFPALTDKQKSTGCWDKDAEPEYGAIDTCLEQPQDDLQSAFARKDVCDPASLADATSKGPIDFIGNVRDALRVLEGTGLNAPTRSKIVIEYADRQCKKASGRDAVLDWSVLRLEVDAFLMRSNNHDILDKMCCGVCRRATDGKTRGGKNYAKMPSSRAELIRHFGTHHQSNIPTWPRDMFTLPSDKDVSRTLSKATAEANRAFNALFPTSREPPEKESASMNILAAVANQQHRLGGRRPEVLPMASWRQPQSSHASTLLQHIRPSIPPPPFHLRRHAQPQYLNQHIHQHLHPHLRQHHQPSHPGLHQPLHHFQHQRSLYMHPHESNPHNHLIETRLQSQYTLHVPGPSPQHPSREEGLYGYPSVHGLPHS